jgi:hypothetical protein
MGALPVIGRRVFAQRGRTVSRCARLRKLVDRYAPAVPYRLRLFSGEQLLVTTEHETTEEVGRRAAEFPLGELMEERPDGSPGASIQREVTYRDEAGQERPASPEEQDEVLFALSERASEIGEAQVEPCQRCGLRRPEHPEPHYPVRGTREGPIYFSCWTPEERESAGL